jgi:protease-4
MRRLLLLIWTIIKVFLLAVGALAVLFLLLIVAVAIAAPHGHRIADKSVLVFNLNTRITDSPPDESAEALARLFDRDDSTLQLRAATRALRTAAGDSRISGLYLHGNLRVTDYSSGYGALKELREAIQDFQKSGKPVIAYISDADNRDYYLESAADQILLNPLGTLAFRGMAADGMFFKGACDKYGLEFTAVRRGKFKSAVEPFTRENFSPESREQLNALLKTLWGDVLDTVAGARKLSPEQLQSIVDKDGLISAEQAKENGLVTELAYESAALDKLRELTGKTTNDSTFPQISIPQYARETERNSLLSEYGKEKIAVVYAEGTIVDGEGQRRSEGEVAGSRFARIIRELRERKDVKAIVLRVNSPGGSGEASDAILDELRRFNDERPVIVSMGTVAASGGYFISMASRRILAEPTTITGSIGVFGLMVNAQKIANDHGITFDSVKTADMADLGTISRPMTPQEHAVIQNLVNNFYDKFLERVASCRKLTTNRVDEIAQGRVWSGADAQKIGLVDEMGGLQRAIEIAAQDANLGANYAVVEYPRPKTLAEQIAEAIGRNQQPLVDNSFAGRFLRIATEEWNWLSSFNDPRGVYSRLPVDLDLN